MPWQGHGEEKIKVQVQKICFVLNFENIA